MTVKQLLLGMRRRKWGPARIRGTFDGEYPRPHTEARGALEAYLTRLASAEPTPGGGSAAAVVAAIGAALVAMVARVTLENARMEEKHEGARRLAQDADDMRARLLEARDEDERAYRRVVDAMALPRGTDEERSERAASLQRSLAGAAEAPLKVAALAHDVLALSRSALDTAGKSIVSDVGCAAEFAASGVDAAALNVRINHRFMTDLGAVARQASTLETLERDAKALLERVRAAVRERLS